MRSVSRDSASSRVHRLVNVTDVRQNLLDKSL